jgi:proteasome lid subunit RPN8/RPN11
VTPTVRDALLAHAREGRARDPPVEVCGVLAGERERERDDGERGGADGSDAAAERASGTVTATRRVPNVAPEPRTRYELDPAATMTALEGLETDGLAHLGFYHSHPDGPLAPSATDRDGAHWPGYVYAIVAPFDTTGASGSDGEGGDADADEGDREGALGAWLWTGDAFERLDVRVVDNG